MKSNASLRRMIGAAVSPSSYLALKPSFSYLFHKWFYLFTCRFLFCARFYHFIFLFNAHITFVFIFYSWKFNNWIGGLRLIFDMHVVLLYTKFNFSKFLFKKLNVKLSQTKFGTFFYDQILIFSFLETFSILFKDDCNGDYADILVALAD